MKTLYSAEMNILSKNRRYIISVALFIIAVVAIASHYIPALNKLSLPAIIAIVVIAVILMAFVLFFKVNIVANTNAITYRVFVTKEIRKKDVEKIELKDPESLRAYGGWGYRSVRGVRAFVDDDASAGVLITVKDGPKILIVCSNSERIYRAFKD